MKRIIIFISLLFLGCVSNAQDTLTTFKPSWFYNYHSPERPIGGFTGTGKCDITKVFYTDQPRYIYGVAVAVNTINGMQSHWRDLPEDRVQYFLEHIIIDTAFAHCEEFVRAYGFDKDTITILREGLCNLGTPPSYYLELPEEVAPHWMDKCTWLLHFYEIYFDTPLWVTDSFYVGMTQYLPKKDPVTRMLPQWPLAPVASTIPDADRAGLDLPFNILFSPDSNCAQWYYAKDVPSDLLRANNLTSIYNGYTKQELWFFPIVDSNTWHPDPPEAIAPMPTTPAVNVSPNPTTGKVTVQSEHTISHIEIYDSHGQLVDIHNTRAASCELDLSTHPSGVYFLHIYTSAGTVPKRISLIR